MKASRLSVAVCALFCASVAHGVPRSPGDTWLKFKTPKEAGFSPRKLDEAKKFWKSTGSAAAMVVHDGAVVAAWGDVERRFMLHSARKSIMNALYGLHVDAGRIDLGKTLEQLGIDDTNPPLNAKEKQATIHDLLRARSGVYHTAAAEPGENRKPKRGSHAPGTHWCYNNWDFNALCTIIEQEADIDIFEDFKKRIAEPLGMEDFRVRDGSHVVQKGMSIHPSYPMRMSARDMARFGLLYLNSGNWNGERIISEDWVCRSTRVHSDDAWGDGYGYLWWISFQEPFKSHKMYSALGVGEQSIDVIPGANIVFVIRSNTYAGQETTRAQRLKLIELVLDAKTSEPSESPKLVPLPSARKKIRHTKLTAKQRNALCGPTTVVPFGGAATIFLDGDDLVLDGPMGKIGLIPTGKGSFVMEDVEWKCRLEPADEGGERRFVIDM